MTNLRVKMKTIIFWRNRQGRWDKADDDQCGGKAWPPQSAFPTTNTVATSSAILCAPHPPLTTLSLHIYTYIYIKKQPHIHLETSYDCTLFLLMGERVGKVEHHIKSMCSIFLLWRLLLFLCARILCGIVNDVNGQRIKLEFNLFGIRMVKCVSCNISNSFYDIDIFRITEMYI